MIEGNVYYYIITFFTILLLVLVLISMVIVVSFKEHRKKKKEGQWLTLIDKKITAAVVQDTDEMEIADSVDFKALLKNHAFREQFLCRLVQAQKKFSGMAEDRLIELFNRYKLQKEALQKIRSSKDYVITQGISELRSMNVESALPSIQKLAFHQSMKVRQEAQLALIHFKGFNGLEFLSEVQWNISKWHRIQLSLALADVKLSDESKLAHWLMSSQPSVVAFSLELMRRYQTLSLYNNALKVLHHPNIEIQKDAIQTLVFLENESTVNTLIEKFPLFETEVQKSILLEMARLKDPLVKQFLKEQFTRNSNRALQLEAAKSLIALDEKLFLEHFAMEHPDSIERKLAHHALDLAS